jgi:hypothetical protein
MLLDRNLPIYQKVYLLGLGEAESPALGQVERGERDAVLADQGEGVREKQPEQDV